MAYYTIHLLNQHISYRCLSCLVVDYSYQYRIDLPGGQWQKIAIMRAIVNSAPVRLLDEPTAALDPLSESEMYKNFEKLSKGYTSIFITHRLASVKTTNMIFVVDNGRIIESGTHDELMANKAKYHTMYEAQKGWYL
jgi:ABC-type multidrug transport system fused ATPase/permease subunit